MIQQNQKYRKPAQKINPAFRVKALDLVALDGCKQNSAEPEKRSSCSVNQMR